MVPEKFPFTVHSKPGKMLWYSVICAGFVTTGVFLACREEPIGWFCAAFFGLGVLISLVQLHPRASFLTVDEQGFEFCTLFRRHRLKWSDVAEFGVITLRHNGIRAHTMVGLNYSEGYPRYLKARGLSRAMTGFDGGLPDTYGFSAEELAALLSACHAALTATEAETARENGSSADD